VDFDTIANFTSLALDLDMFVQILFERGTIEDTVTRGTRVVNDELVLNSSSFSGGGLDLMEREERKGESPV